MDLQKLKDQLVKHEGLRYFPYVDTVGKVTIGVGHNLTDKGLTQAQVQGILSDDITETIAFVGKNLPWVLTDLDDVRQRAVLDMAFDLMGKVLTFHTMLGCLQNQDWAGASNALLASKFATQTGKRAQDLSRMILTGVDV